MLLGAAEVGLRLHRPDGDISYRMSEQEYRFLPLELRRFGSASVVVIGSSRAREGVSIPVLRDKSAEPGSSRTYASYAIAAGRASTPSRAPISCSMESSRVSSCPRASRWRPSAS